MAVTNRYAQKPRSAPAATRPTPGRRPATTIRSKASPSTTTKKPLFIAGAALASLATVVSVINLVDADSPGPQAACAIGVDAQGSARTMRDSYRLWIPDQAKTCAADDRADLSIMLISGQTRTGTVTPVTGKLSGLNYTGNKSDDDKIAKNEIDRVVKEADKAILTAPKQRGRTDIIGVLCVAHDLLSGHSPSTLIINSDGINSREPYRLNKIPLDDASITKYVDQLKADGQLCDLTGTQVHMYGVGIGTLTDTMSDERLTGIRKFWEAVIRATGADLVTYQRNP